MSPSTRHAGRSPVSNALAVAGALMVLVGAQLPAVEFQLLGGLSFRQLFGAAGAALIVAALGALGAVALGHAGGLKLCAVACWCALLWPLLRAGYERGVARERGPLDEVGDALEQVVSDSFRQSITGVRAGAFVLLAGCVLLGLGAFGRRSTGSR